MTASKSLRPGTSIADPDNPSNVLRPTEGGGIIQGGATYQLLVDAGADGDPVTDIVAGDYIFAAAGTFGGATVALSYLGPDGATYIPLTDTELTSAGAVTVRIGQGATVKATVTGGAPSGLYANLT